MLARELTKPKSDNAWQWIKLSDYETHMREISQLPKLAEIMNEQMKIYNPKSVAVLGAAGGNGFKHLHTANKIYAVDINKKYLETLQKRHKNLEGKLELVPCDLNTSTPPKCDLLICNLIIEFLGIDNFAQLLERSDFKVASCVIQRNRGNDYMSKSSTAHKLALLNNSHYDIDRDELIEKVKFDVIDEKVNKLPNSKEFVQIDFAGKTFNK